SAVLLRAAWRSARGPCTSSRPSSSTAWNTKACAPKSELAPPVKKLIDLHLLGDLYALFISLLVGCVFSGGSAGPRCLLGRLHCQPAVGRRGILAGRGRGNARHRHGILPGDR